jgi:hypothetical protein
MVTGESFSISPIKEFVPEFSVDNSYYSHLPEAVAGDRIILTTRNQEDWLRSMANYPKEVDKPYPPMVNYLLDVDAYYSRNPLLVVDWNDCKDYQCNWEKLCDFLGEYIPTADFPCKNCPDGH